MEAVHPKPGNRWFHRVISEVCLEHVRTGNFLEILFEVCPFWPIPVLSQAGVFQKRNVNVNDLVFRDKVE